MAPGVTGTRAESHVQEGNSMKHNIGLLSALIGLAMLASPPAGADGFTFAYAFGDDCG
jgi:hypothetical protein